MNYILDENKNVILEPDLQVWAKQFDSPHKRVVKKTFGRVKIDGEDAGEVEISTVFLGIDHGFGETPLLFETMIFGSPLDEYQTRCSTWQQAEAMHQQAINTLTQDFDVEFYED